MGCADVGEKSPDVGEEFPDLGERSPEMGERFPDVERVCPDVGERSPDVGEVSPDLGASFPEMGGDVPRLWGRLSPRWVSLPALSCFALRSFRVLVGKFVASTMTEHRWLWFLKPPATDVCRAVAPARRGDAHASRRSGGLVRVKCRYFSYSTLIAVT